MPRRTNMGVLALRRSSGDPNDPTRAFWKFTEPDLPPVSGSPSPYTTAPPINYTGTPGVDYEHSIPMETPRPAEFYENQSGVFENVPSATIYPSGPDYAGFRGDEFFSGDFEENRAESFPPAQTNRLEPSFLFGEPTVQTPTATAQSAGTLDAEPSLFPGGGVNPFDEWWKAGAEPIVTGNVSANAELGLPGGTAYLDAPFSQPVADVSWNNPEMFDVPGLTYSPTAEGAVSVSPQQPVGGELVADTPFNPVPEPTGVPVEPSPLNQNAGDVEWTTSPEERRFLPGSEPTQSANAGGDISSFGTFGSPLTLGQVFNAPLSSLRYGEGYPDIGHVYSAGTEDTTGTTFIDQGEGLTDRELADRHAQEIRNNATNPRPESSNDPFNTPSAGDMHLYFGDQPLSPGAYDQATFGGLRPTGYRDTRGSATFDSHAANLRLMDFMAFGGAPNRYSPDSPSTFYRGHYRLDDFGGFEQVSDITSGFGPGLDTSGNWWANNAGRSSSVGGRGRGG